MRCTIFSSQSKSFIICIWCNIVRTNHYITVFYIRNLQTSKPCELFYFNIHWYLYFELLQFSFSILDNHHVFFQKGYRCIIAYWLSTIFIINSSTDCVQSRIKLIVKCERRLCKKSDTYSLRFNYFDLWSKQTIFQCHTVTKNQLSLATYRISILDCNASSGSPDD